MAEHTALRGTVTGELDGFPVSVVDTRPRRGASPGTKRVMRTVCVVHLSGRYPAMLVRELWRDESDRTVPAALLHPPLADLDHATLRRCCNGRGSKT